MLNSNSSLSVFVFVFVSVLPPFFTFAICFFWLLGYPKRRWNARTLGGLANAPSTNFHPVTARLGLFPNHVRNKTGFGGNTLIAYIPIVCLHYLFLSINSNINYRLTYHVMSPSVMKVKTFIVKFTIHAGRKFLPQLLPHLIMDNLFIVVIMLPGQYFRVFIYLA